MRSTVIAAVLLLASAHARAAADRPASSTTFALRGHSDIVVPVFVNGQGPFRFLLDTGSSRSAVSRRLADRLGMRPVASTLMLTPAGRATQPVVVIERLAVGPHTRPGILAMTLEPGFLRSADGLVGQDMLAPLTYTIDYVRRQVVWQNSGIAPRGSLRLPLEPEEGRFLVTLPQRSLRAPLRFVPDSGTDGWVLFGGAAADFTMSAPIETVGLQTLSGLRLFRRVVIDELDVGTITLRNVIATTVDRREPDAPREDGLLPLHLFARVTFESAARSLTLEPR